ncbi:MAG: flavocytochrome c [Bacillota bacterium]|nr:FAD-binding dehydrogenase [Bacillota bacterium]
MRFTIRNRGVVHLAWDAETDVVVVGAGGCGLVAALAAAEHGAQVVILEKTERVLGNTAASAGMIPAAGTRFQKALGIEDSPEQMAADILRKNDHQSDPELTLALCQESARLVEWMVDSLGIELSVVQEFKYPGHSTYRMHAPISRSGLDLIKMLRQAVNKRDNIILMLQSPVTDLVAEDGAVVGVVTQTPMGEQRIRAQKVILACNGFGGNRELVAKYIPEMADAMYFGYEGNTGEAILWGEKLGAQLENMHGFQGHSSVSAGQGILVTWGVVMMGGFMVNVNGERFGDETQGYSEFSLEVMKQPQQTGFLIFDQSIHDQLLSIEDFRQLASMNAFKFASTPEELAKALGIPAGGLAATFEEVRQAAASGGDRFGRTDFAKVLEPPYCGIRVVPALFHTQGGLKINRHAQVLRKDGTPIPNLYAGGGSAVGVSGNHPKGYMSGNGLLAALGFGKIAGEHAAKSLALQN